jgi:hypothetical protein
MARKDNLSLNTGLQVLSQIKIISKALPKHLSWISQGKKHFTFNFGCQNRQVDIVNMLRYNEMQVFCQNTSLYPIQINQLHFFKIATNTLVNYIRCLLTIRTCFGHLLRLSSACTVLKSTTKSCAWWICPRCEFMKCYKILKFLM